MIPAYTTSNHQLLTFHIHRSSLMETVISQAWYMHQNFKDIYWLDIIIRPTIGEQYQKNQIIAILLTRPWTKIIASSCISDHDMTWFDIQTARLRPQKGLIPLYGNTHFNNSKDDIRKFLPSYIVCSILTQHIQTICETQLNQPCTQVLPFFTTRQGGGVRKRTESTHG